MKLFAVLLGGSGGPGRFSEDHETVFVVADDERSAKKAAKAFMIKQMVADLSDSTLHDLSAIGYFIGVDAKKSQVTRLAGNNCSPLVNK